MRVPRTRDVRLGVGALAGAGIGEIEAAIDDEQVGRPQAVEEVPGVDQGGEFHGETAAAERWAQQSSAGCCNLCARRRICMAMSAPNDSAETSPRGPLGESGAVPQISAAERDFWRRAVEAERARLALEPRSEASRSRSGLH